MIDQNRDGYVDKDDLFEMYTSLGKNPTEEELDVMINMAPGPINFTMFLTLFGEKLNGTDPEDVIKNAFACFDDKNSGGCADYTCVVVLHLCRGFRAASYPGSPNQSPRREARDV